jgi:hypothetical protein
MRRLDAHEVINGESLGSGSRGLLVVVVLVIIVVFIGRRRCDIRDCVERVFQVRILLLQLIDFVEQFGFRSRSRFPLTIFGLLFAGLSMSVIRLRATQSS